MHCICVHSRLNYVGLPTTATDCSSKAPHPIALLHWLDFSVQCKLRGPNIDRRRRVTAGQTTWYNWQYNCLPANRPDQARPRHSFSAGSRREIDIILQYAPHSIASIVESQLQPRDMATTWTRGVKSKVLDWNVTVQVELATLLVSLLFLYLFASSRWK